MEDSERKVIVSFEANKPIHRLSKYTDRVTIVLSVFSVSAAILWVYIVQCKHDNISRVLQGHPVQHDYYAVRFKLQKRTSSIKLYEASRMLSMHTTWRCNAMTILLSAP